MSLLIKEYIGSEVSEAKFEKIHLQESSPSADAIDPNSLMVKIEAIHAYPHATRNYTRYMPKAIKNSVHTWTAPYRKPLIKHHNDKDGEIIGRIIDAEYITKNTLSETPALVITANVPGDTTKKDVLSGILSTTSIGVIAHDVRCSICGAKLADGETCEHERGAVYENEVCYWDIYDMEAKELSYVIVPSDIYSKNIDIYPASKNKKISSLGENFNGIKGEPNHMTLEEALQQLEANKEAMTELEATKKELETKVAALEESVNTLTADKEALETEKATLTTSLTEKEERISTLEEEAKEQKQLFEGLETKHTELVSQLKEAKIDHLQTLRKVLGKSELNKEVIEQRNESSISDSILDMKEDLQVLKTKEKDIQAPPLPDQVKDPSLQEGEKDNAATKVQTINLREEMLNLFNGVSGARNYK